MSEPRDFETRTSDADLTTEQLANAGRAEPRSFEQGDRVEPGRQDDKSVQRLFADDEAAELRRAWDELQVGFVDEPRRSVEGADHLVASTMKRLAEVFAEERQRLESQWDRGDDVSTEDLRVALQRYRSFFTRLLSV